MSSIFDPQPRTRVRPPQKTIRREVTAPGIGVHTGKNVTLRLLPDEENRGIRFRRIDLEGSPELQVSLSNVKSEALVRMTVLQNRDWKGEDKYGWGASVGMIEHLLAACSGMGVTNLIAELDAPECPIFDGSGLEYVRLLTEAGIVDQPAPIKRYRLEQPFGLIKEKTEIIAIPAETTRYTFFAEFRHAGLEDQQATFELYADNFAEEVAPARTFCFWKDIEGLLKAGLIKGGSTDNAIVIKDGSPVKVDESNQPHADKNFAWRIPSELARHKLLDLIGDMAILGGPVLALISARAAGHALHQEFARELSKVLIED